MAQLEAKKLTLELKYTFSIYFLTNVCALIRKILQITKNRTYCALIGACVLIRTNTVCGHFSI